RRRSGLLTGLVRRCLTPRRRTAPPFRPSSLLKGPRARPPCAGARAWWAWGACPAAPPPASRFCGPIRRAWRSRGSGDDGYSPGGENQDRTPRPIFPACARKRRSVARPADQGAEPPRHRFRVWTLVASCRDKDDMRLGGGASLLQII